MIHTLLADIAKISETLIGSLCSYEEEENGLRMICENGSKIILPYKEGALRMIVTSSSHSNYTQYPLHQQIPAAFMFEEKEENLCLTTLDMHLVIQKSPLQISIYDRFQNEVVTETTDGVYFSDTDGMTCRKQMIIGDSMEIVKKRHSTDDIWSDLYVIKSNNKKYGLLFHRDNDFSPSEDNGDTFTLSSTTGILDYFVLTENAVNKILEVF